jgi:2-polyprenyl-6-hydroxyphenyl methylase/3-demethylubiquinone-9 3-methyltransferase
MTSMPSWKSADPFAEYYAEESLSASTIARFSSTKDAVLRVLRRAGLLSRELQVADIGCGAGTQSMLWARDGHHVSGIDINDTLVGFARKRAAEAGLEICFECASAVKIPWTSGSMDVCLLPELLEHVAEWEACLAEAVRVLKPHGLLYLSTTNRLCPVQQEFDLQFYSWYPGWLKRRYEKLSVTTRPELVNHAKFPAVNWFDFYSLRRSPQLRGFRCLDRFDVAALAEHGAPARVILALIRGVAPLRWLGHVATPYTAVFAVGGSSALAAQR